MAWLVKSHKNLGTSSNPQNPFKELGIDSPHAPSTVGGEVFWGGRVVSEATRQPEEPQVQ